MVLYRVAALGVFSVAHTPSTGARAVLGPRRLNRAMQGGDALSGSFLRIQGDRGLTSTVC